MEFLNQIVKESKNEYVGFVSDGVAAGDISGFVDTGSYMLNAIVSGSIFGGIPSNKITALAGESGVGKTYFCLSVVRYFLDSNPDGMVVYFESESAISSDMFESRGIDTSRVLLYPVETIQEFREVSIKIVENYLKQDEKKPMMFVLDSLGNLPTQKEVDDAIKGSEARDFTKSQIVKSTFRVLTMKLGKAGIPMLMTNHTYDVIGSYVPTKEMGGGSGLKYASSTIIFLSKKKEKDGTEHVGNIIKCEAKKSRLTKEGSKAEVQLFFDARGLQRYHGLLDYAPWPSSGGRYEIDGKKFWGKEIMKDPEKFFTPEVLEQIDTAISKQFKYGVDDDE
jgi:RecA/RadA recombinase